MEKFNDGGPAFPTQTIVEQFGEYHRVVAGGMSLRDWFAGQALAGLLAHPQTHGMSELYMHALADTSYEIANAMLAIRKREGA